MNFLGENLKDETIALKSDIRYTRKNSDMVNDFSILKLSIITISIIFDVSIDVMTTEISHIAAFNLRLYILIKDTVFRLYKTYQWSSYQR